MFHLNLSFLFRNSYRILVGVYLDLLLFLKTLSKNECKSNEMVGCLVKQPSSIATIPFFQGIDRINESVGRIRARPIGGGTRRGVLERTERPSIVIFGGRRTRQKTSRFVGAVVSVRMCFLANSTKK